MKSKYSREQYYELIEDVFTEGHKTEIQYINDFVRKCGKMQKIRASHQNHESDPVNLVGFAIEYAKQLNIRKNETPHHVWVVFDCDERYEKVREALKKIEQHNAKRGAKKIYCAFMKPCVEVWALLHFTTTLPQKHDRVQSELHRRMVTYDHSNNPIFDISKLSDQGYQQALNRARSWDTSLSDPNKPDEASFFAGIYQLTEEILNI